MARKKNIWIYIALVLAILLVATFVYIGIGKYKQSKEIEKSQIFQNGVQFGYEGAVEQLMNNAENCSIVDVYAGNKTVKFVDVACV